MKNFLKQYEQEFGKSKCIACSLPLENNIFFFGQVYEDDLFSKKHIFTCKNCGMSYTFPFLTIEREKELYLDYLTHHLEEKIKKNEITFFNKIKFYIENTFGFVFFKFQIPAIKIFLSCFLFQRLFQSYPLFTHYKKGKRKILDFGCADGYFLTLARKFNFEPYGVEYSDQLVSNLKINKISATTELGDFVQAKEKFDIIRINHVLEHIGNPEIILRKVWSLLKNDGELMIGVTNFNTFSKIFKEYFWLHLPYHRFHFTRKSIYEILKKNGFNVRYYKTKSIGIFYICFLRRFKKNIFLLKIIDILLSIFLDMLNCGDCIEVYAKKNAIDSEHGKIS